MLGDNFLLNFLLDELKSIPPTTKKNEGRNKLKGLRYIYQNEKRKQNRPTEQNKSLSMYNIRPSIELINPGRNLESDIKHLTWSTDISGIRNKDGCIKSMTAEKISSQLPEFKQYTIKSFIPVIVSPSYQPSTNLLRFIFNLLLSPSSRNEEERKELGNKKILFKDGAFLAQKKFNKTGLANFLKIATTKFFLAPKGFKNIGGNRYAKQATPLIFMYFFTAIVGIRRTYHSIEGSKNFSMGNSYSSLVDPEVAQPPPTSPPILLDKVVGDVVSRRSHGALLKNARGAGDSETNQRQEQKIELFEIAQESNFFSVLDENLYQFLRLTDYITKIFVIWAFHNFVTRPALGKNSLGGSKREISDSNQARIIWPVMSLFELISNRFSFLLFISNYLNKKRMEFLPTNSSPEIETENPKFIQNKRRIFGEQKKQKEVKGLARLQAIQSFEPILEILLLSLKKEEQVRDSKNIFNSPKGYLFVGPPGTGKTLLAQAIAEEAAVPLICLSASEIQKQIEIGTRIGALRLRKLFDQARKLAPCILFLDEIDSIGGARFTALDPQKSFNIVGEGMEHPKFGSDSRAGDAVTSDENTGHWSPRLYHERDCVRLRHQEGVSDVVSESEYYSQKRLYEDQKSPQSPQDGGLFTEFLIQMDSFSIKDRFVVIGTTNNLSSLDSAFIRAGRFDRILGFTYPSKKARIDILKFYSKKFFQTKQGPNINLSSSPDIREPVNKLLTHSVSPNEVSWNYFGKYTNGFSPAHLSRLVNEARLYSISRNKKEKKVSFENLQQGFNRITKPK